jgi:hypothetical protein
VGITQLLLAGAGTRNLTCQHITVGAPNLYRDTVYPGGVFNGVLAASTDIKKMRFSLGYDFYLQQAEKIKKLHNTNTTLDQLRIEDAQRKKQNLIMRLTHAETQKRLQGLLGELTDGQVFEKFDAKVSKDKRIRPTQQTKKITDAESKTMLKAAYDKLLSISQSLEGLADTAIAEQGKAAEPDYSGAPSGPPGRRHHSGQNQTRRYRLCYSIGV